MQYLTEETMRILTGLMALFLCAEVMAETVTISWQDVLDANTLGYRVYEYRDDSKILRYEGIDTQYIQVIEESTVFGVASFNEYSESEVIPRAVILEKPEPTRVSWTITVGVQ